MNAALNAATSAGPVISAVAVLALWAVAGPRPRDRRRRSTH